MRPGILPPLSERPLVVVTQGARELPKRALKRFEGTEHGFSVLTEDGRPKRGVGPGNAGSVAVRAGREVEELGGYRGRERRRHGVG